MNGDLVVKVEMNGKSETFRVADEDIRRAATSGLSDVRRVGDHVEATLDTTALTKLFDEVLARARNAAIRMRIAP